MLPLLFPWIILALLIIALVSSFYKKWRYVVSLMVFAIIVNWWSECIPFRLWPVCQNTVSRSISVLTFNISTTKEKKAEKAEMLAILIGKKSPDIIYVSELSKSSKRSLDTLLVKDYPYSLYHDSHGFYSKYPLSERVMSEGENINKGRVIKALVVKGGYSLTLYGCHLTSNNYSIDSKYITPDSIKNRSTLIQYAKDINLAYSKRFRVAGIITRDASSTREHIIVLGDMNDVGGSKTISQLESIGLKDAWWDGGFGYGATIHKQLPYRIDHILYSNELKLNKVKVVSSEGLSDHDAVFAEFSY